MKLIAINGSPRKRNSTAILLEKALAGAASEGAETELIHLYDLDFKGCKSCFACKVKDGPSFGKCALQDDLTPVIKKLREADGFFLGSPIYYGAVTGEARSFMERYLFAPMQYSNVTPLAYEKNQAAGFIYTMNIPDAEMAKVSGLELVLEHTAACFKMLTNHAETLYSYDTYQFDDHSKYLTDRVDVEKKEQVRREQFPEECQKAFEMGARFARGEVKFEKFSMQEMLEERAKAK